jgi:hypothetical protein
MVNPMTSDLDERLGLAREALARRLSSIYETWTVEGENVIGPGTLGVRVEDRHKMGPRHFDIGFVLNRERSDVPVLWDCVGGLGEANQQIANRAVETWITCNFPVMLEFFKRDGSFAEHFLHNDPQGCPGWHVIHGPVLGFGAGKAPHELQAWVIKNPLLPILGPLVVGAFERPQLNGVKVFLGFGAEEIAEVRVNEVCHQPASDRLKSLDWPRAAEAAFARFYCLFVHKD